MATLHRVLIRLAIAWIVIVGGSLLLYMAYGGLSPDSNPWPGFFLATGVPALLLGALAWIIKPPSNRA